MFYHSPIPLQTIDVTAYEKLKSGAELIVSDRISPKVMKNNDDLYLKFFRRKRFISSALFAPYAVRFICNAFELKNRSITTITPTQLWYCPEKKMHIVAYKPIEGGLLRTQLEKQGDKQLLEAAAGFIAKLHYKGIYFRSLHFENIVVNNDNFGLIDVADMKIYSKPLSKNLRQRNFQHFLRYPQDRKLIDNYGKNEFQSQYDTAFEKYSA